MNKILFLVLFAVSAMMFACGSQGGSPPELKNSQVGYISPFDTLVAEFDANIVNINDLGANITFSLQEMVQVFPGKSTTSSNKLYFIGTYDTTLGGLPYFKPGVMGSIVFSNLKNEDGYVQEKAVLSFLTYRIFDSQYNGTEASADDLDSFDQEIKVTDEITFAGVLDSLVAITEQGIIYDTEDYFKLELHARDTINIEAKNFRESLKVNFYGPGNVDTTIDAKKGNSNVLKYVISTDHLTGADTLGTMVPFYIKVYTDRNTSSPNPYVLSVFVKRGKI